jgi:hypothetical protein
MVWSIVNFVVQGVTEYIDPNESTYEDEDVGGTDF